MLRPKFWITMAAILVITAALAGCGGGSKSSSSTSGGGTASTTSTTSASGGSVSAASYVKSVCAAIGPFEKDVASRSSALNLSSITKVSDGKKALVGFLGAMVSDTGNAVNQLQAAGTPNVANGKAIAAGVVSAFTQLKTALTQAASQANALPTGSATAFKTAATTLGNVVRTSMGSIGSGLSGLKSPDLEKAANADPTCKSLATG